MSSAKKTRKVIFLNQGGHGKDGLGLLHFLTVVAYLYLIICPIKPEYFEFWVLATLVLCYPLLFLYSKIVIRLFNQ
jgi:hypothetical protein